LANAAGAGITLNNDGTLSFDQSTFTSAYSANPSAVQSLFVQGGTFAPAAGSPAASGDISLNYAGDTTLPGSYDVTITQSASQATASGSQSYASAGSTVATGETLSVQMGGTTVSYTTSAGQSLSSIASGLNASFASNGLGVTAQVATGASGSYLKVTSASYGSTQTFSVQSTAMGAGTTGLATTANTWTAYTGTDVAGSINGVAATGNGQFLAAPVTDPTLKGLTLQVTTAGVTSSTDLGTFTYAPGVAALTAQVAQQASDPVTGSITTTVQNLQQETTDLTTQIQSYQPMIDAERATLQQEFADMETQLGTLKNQSSWLSSQLAQLP
jgi:flagellar hook-associated protein 2